MILSEYRNDNPKLGVKQLKDGRDSLFLDYYLGFHSATSKSGRVYKKPINRRESLGLYMKRNPRTPEERKENKETLNMAKEIRRVKSQELRQGREGYHLEKPKFNDFLCYIDSFRNSYIKKQEAAGRKKSANNMKSAVRYFRDFLKSCDSYKNYSQTLPSVAVDKNLVSDFVDYLKAHFSGGTPAIYYGYFKQIVNTAVEEGELRVNPCKGVTVPIDRNVVTKDILSLEEMSKLRKAEYTCMYPDIKRAFLFTLHTGIRFCDVSRLTFSNVDYANNIMMFTQAKTSDHSSAASVSVLLNFDMLQLIGKPKEGQGKDDRIFDLPCYNTCIAHLGKWVEAAGINKHITWHCGRHSFAMAALTTPDKYGRTADIYTVAKMLGHSSTEHTEKYLHTVDKLKQSAYNAIKF